MTSDEFSQLGVGGRVAMISFSPFTDMILIWLCEMFLGCQLCCLELGCEGHNVQREQGEWHVGRAWHRAGVSAVFPSFQQGLSMFCPTSET